MQVEASTVVFRRTYDETLNLMIEARNYLAYRQPQERRRVGSMVSLRMSCEAFRITSRLTQVMAWLMIQRAAENGEVSFEEACSEDYRLSGEAVCLDDSAAEDEELPPALRSLLDRSHRLYLRVSRLDGMVRDRLH